MPAICNNPKCGAVFPSSIQLDNCRGISFNDCGAGSCPKCGSMGRISDGTYDAIADEISGILKNESDLAILEKMKVIVEKAINNKDFKEAKNELSTISPNWKNAFNILPEENIGNALAIYMFILAMIQTAITLYALNKPIDSDTFINNSYEFFYNESPQIQQETPQKEHKPRQIHPLSSAIKRSLT